MQFIKELKKVLRPPIQGHIKKYQSLYRKYKDYSMISTPTFTENLRLIASYPLPQGDVVECGVWRGGMMAAISELLGDKRSYYLFDSFEGLPKAKPIDGPAAQQWQADTKSEIYYDNCRAEIHFAKQAMKLAGVSDFYLVKGWFENTLPQFDSPNPIALLRLDGDWYDSTWQCLEHLYPRVAPRGLIIIDDYYTWDGCSKAIHDYLSAHKLNDRIFMSPKGVCYIIKKP